MPYVARNKGLFLLFIMGINGFLGSCERVERRARANYNQINQLGGYSSDQIEFKDIRSFYKKVFGTSDDDYWTEWDKLDQFRSGAVIFERIPYLDSWYPEKPANQMDAGGTNVNGALTLYDQAFNGGTKSATLWELNYNSRESPSWYGHCNGTSVASSRYQNPLTNVYRPQGCELDESTNCVVFTPSDIRALLAEISMNTKAKFISGNRCRLSVSELEKRPKLRANPLEMDACDDVNPGSFHVGLINFLGRHKQPVIVDFNRDEEVWNYPVYEYEYVSEGPLTEEEAIQTIQMASLNPEDANTPPDFEIDDWVFNPSAVSWRLVTMTLSYRRATTNDFTNAGSKPDATRAVYTYLLEFDEEDKILGGEWVGASKTDHPDFLWMAFEPDEPTGSASRGNPYVDNDEVISIWAESVGFDPSNPFRDKPSNPYDVRFYPRGDLDWGIVEGYYRIVLDGRTNGAVFLGKETYLRILIADVIEDNVEVDVFLNGKSIGRKTSEDGKIDLTFESPKGINYINLKWYSDRVKSSELDWEFRYIAI